MTRVVISNNHTRAEVHSLGGMVGPVFFQLGDRAVQPFAIAPWSEDRSRRISKLPGILRNLRGEWPCVPYGILETSEGLPSEWTPATDWDGFQDPHPHGFAANHHWSFDRISDADLDMSIIYPEEHPIARVSRTIRLSDESPEIRFAIRVEARRKIRLPIGLHPTFCLPPRPGAAHLEFASGARIWTRPAALEPACAYLLPDQVNVPLHKVPTSVGFVDISRLPLDVAAEEVLLVLHHGGRATLKNEEDGYCVSVDWNEQKFPACQIWISNKGRKEFPWNGRFNAVGIEPIAAAFDLGTPISVNQQNPLQRAGVKTAIDLDPAQPFEANYSIKVAALPLS